MQAVLAERDDSLKTANSEKARLEVEAEGFSQRLRSLDESEQRYKDENWNLETQIQETNAAAREAATREQKLQQSLAFATSEKNAAQRELDDLKQDHSKVTEENALVRKNHESELASLRKSVNLGESEKGALQRKVEELTSQNRELANGLAGRFRDEGTEPEADVGAQAEDFPLDLSEREHSPPPSPTKGVHRHSMLESETLKSSLHHAHKMIQNLKGSVHREKTEKQDLKRMLQEARDELEIRRAEPSERRLKAKSQTDMRRIGRPALGAARNSRTDVLIDNPEQDPDWEDQSESSPLRGVVPRFVAHNAAPGLSRLGDSSDTYQTANETEDAFETANERDTTDNDAFQTGAESMAGDTSDEKTETESGVARVGTIRTKKAPPQASAKPSNRRSIQSTASTSEDEDPQLVHTPQGYPQRFRLKVNRNSRRSRVGSESYGNSNPSTAKNSPASFTNGGADPSQSLYAELENLSGDDNDGTPSKGSISSPMSAQSLQRSLSDKRSLSSMRIGTGSQPSIPALGPNTVVYNGETPPVPRIPTVDSSMMTEPWEPTQSSSESIQAAPSQPNVSPESSGTLPRSSAAAITGRIFAGTPRTPQNKGLQTQPTSGSNIGSTSTSTSTPPRPVWDQPLQMFAGIIPGFNQSTDSTPLSTRSATSQIRGVPGETSDEQRLQSSSSELAQGDQPPEPISGLSNGAVTKTSNISPPPLSLSPIHSLETAPIQSIHRNVTGGVSEAIQLNETGPTTSASADAAPKDNTNNVGIFGSVFGWNKTKAATTPQIAEDETSQESSAVQPTPSDGKTPLRELSMNYVGKNTRDVEDGPEHAKVASMDMADHGSQTLLSSEQIDTMLNKKEKPPFVDTQRTPAASAMKPLYDIGAVSPPLANPRFQDGIDPGKGKGPEQTGRDSLGKSFKRPASVTSMRSRAAAYPPLPPDHQEAIAAAAQRAPSAEPSGGLMGPPLAPASAYTSQSARSRRISRPQTPSQQSYPSPSSKGGTTPRAGRYSTARSQVSRRSSVSSFASELDERFNIRTEGMPMPQGFQPNTDPRMIQAITQTMIGEMMWKYTRKAGRGEMSSTRHRRFFWVHPYTRTLYWSDRDPASANRAELKSKSVAIEAVRVVTDDNPMPPGVHRKSLIIVTPGRSVKFTAQTSQRHETWFNAISYLLLRTGIDGGTNNAGDLTDTDVEEFNPQTGYNRRSSRSRVSLASFRSSRAQNRQDQSRLSSRVTDNVGPTQQQQLDSSQENNNNNRGSVRSRISRSLSRSRTPKVPETNSIDKDHHASVSSRISSYWKPGASVRSSMRSRSSMRESVQEPGVLEGGRSVVSEGGGDSAEDLRRVIEEREQGGRLENVRACCDGESSTLNANNVSGERVKQLTGGLFRAT